MQNFIYNTSNKTVITSRIKFQQSWYLYLRPLSMHLKCTKRSFNKNFLMQKDNWRQTRISKVGYTYDKIIIQNEIFHQSLKKNRIVKSLYPHVFSYLIILCDKVFTPAPVFEISSFIKSTQGSIQPRRSS